MVLILVSVALAVQVAALILETIRRNELPPIPRIIWSYWNDKKLPPLIQKCVDSWKRHMPGYTIRMLSDDNLGTYMDTSLLSLPWVQTHQLRSDVIRLAILAKHGGIWSDASIIMYGKHPLQDAIESNKYEFIGYNNTTGPIKTSFPYVESFYFAARPKSMIVQLWKAAFIDMFPNVSISERADLMLNKVGVEQGNVHLPEYLYVYIAMNLVTQTLLPPEYFKEHTYMQPVDNGNVYEYQIRTNWSSTAMKMLADTPEDQRPRVVKITRGDRHEIEKQNLVDFI